MNMTRILPFKTTRSGVALRIAILLLVLCPRYAVAGKLKEIFIDPQDNHFDITKFMSEMKGFIPVPFVITEPAVGYGGGLAVGFFHDSIASSESRLQAGETDRLVPPSISGGAAFYTENESWGGGLFHQGIWENDTINYEGALFVASLNLEFFGSGEDSELPAGLKYNIEAPFILQEIMFRLHDSDVFAGLKYIYANIETDFEIGDVVPGVPKEDLSSADAGIGLALKYDLLDNMFTPNRGHEIEANLNIHDDVFGGDFSYSELDIQWQGFYPVHKKLVLGVRLSGEFTTGDVPFYALPFVELRGVPAMRYQDSNVFVADSEVRWDFFERYSLVGFVGSGWTGDTIGDFGNAEARVAGGGGVRYLIAKGFRLRTGFDVAVGPEDVVFYLTMGSAW